MLEVKNLCKTYKSKGGVETKALDNVSVSFPETGLVFLLGKSGSGKSTLLNMIGGLDKPDSGEVIVKGRSSKDFSQADFDSYRNTYIGFIFQEYNVLNEFNIEQNISLALQLQGKKNDKEAVNALLKEVDLEGFNKRKPNTLSGGQKQRIAIARALIKQPEIIMADEPTGALDSNTGKQVLETLKKLSKTKLVIIVSHDQDFAEEYGDRIIELKDGKILTDKSKEYVAPKAVNDNVQIVNGNVIDIKNGSKLTEADFKQLYQMIKKQDKEVLISTGEDNIKASKKAMRVSEDGKGERFSDTKEVAVKQYDGKQTKFIRSHMPFSRSFKMGASGLKTKPIRLVLTILLSVVSFAMFGVASTLMFYDPAYSLAKAMENMDRKSEAVTKNYRLTRTSITIDNATGEVTDRGNPYSTDDITYYGAKEVDDLNSSGKKYIGVFTFQNYFSTKNQAFMMQNVTVGTDKDAYDYYSYNYFTGLSDVGSDFFTSNGYRLTGNHPSAKNEIAISNYHFDLIKESNVFGTLNSQNDVLDKTIKMSFNNQNRESMNLDMKIVGVYDFGALSNNYNALKQAKPASQSSNARRDEIDKFSAYLASSFYTTGYVAPAFYEAYGYVPQNDNGSSNYGVYARGIQMCSSREDAEHAEVNPDGGNTFFIQEDLEGNSKYYDTDFKEIEKFDLKENEILLPYEFYYSNYAYYKTFAPLSSKRDAVSQVTGYDRAVQDMVNEMNTYKDEYTTEAGAAYHRIDNYFQNKGSGSQTYPDGYTLEADVKTVNDALDAGFTSCTEKMYLSNVYSYLNERYARYEYESERPANWETEIRPLYEKISSEDGITDAEVASLSAKLKAVIDADTTHLSYVEDAANANSFISYIYWSYRDEINNACEKDYGMNFYSVINEVIGNSGESAEANDRLAAAFPVYYKSVYGDDATVPSGFASKAAKMIVKDSEYKVPEVFIKDAGGTITEYTVKGFIEISGNRNNPVVKRSTISKYLRDSYSWKNEITTQYQKPADEKYAYVIAATNYSQGDIASFTKDNGSYFYKMTNAVYTEASMWTNMINTLKTVFLIVGAVTGALSALLLLNFISVSISSKNKDIGILRAVGARGSDVFKIFFSESAIIGIICFVLAAVSAGITCMYLNNMFVESILGIALLNYGLINILLILGVAIVISFIATFIPVYITSKKPPVEAIRAL